MMGRRNDTVALVRSLTTPGRKRGGARYGPAPQKPPHERMQAPKPMSDDRRDEVSSRDGWTTRRVRQYQRMGARSIYRQYMDRYGERADITSAEVRGEL